MKQYILDIFPPEFHKNTAYWRGFTLGIAYLVMLVAQLFSYEDFAEVVAGYGLPGGMVTVVFLAALIPLLGFLSLPYLFSMKLHKRWRTIGRVAVIVLPSLWLLITLATNISMSGPISIGLFGASIPTPNGWWMVMFAGLLLWSAVLVVQELPERK